MGNLDAFIKIVAHSDAFKSIIMTCILLNTVTFAISSSLELNPQTKTYLAVLDGADSCFLAIYTIEFIIKLYSLRRGYWFNGFNCFDFGVLLCSYLQVVLSQTGVTNLAVIKVARSLRALRPLRSISLIGGLQVVVTALISVLTGSFIHIIALLCLLMFIYGIMAYYIYGYDAALKSELATEYWGTFRQSFLSLFVLVTAEGWVDMKDSLLELSQTFTTYLFIGSFVFIGHFIFGNLFVAVVIEQIDRATAGYQKKIDLKKSTVIARKRRRARHNQQSEIKDILNQQQSVNFKAFHRIVLDMYMHCRSDEFAISSQMLTSCHWADAVVTAYGMLVKRTAKLIPIHRQCVQLLGEILECMETQLLNEQGGSSQGSPNLSHLRRKPASIFRAGLFASFTTRASTHFDADGHSRSSLNSEQDYSNFTLFCMACCSAIGRCRCVDWATVAPSSPNPGPESVPVVSEEDRRYSDLAREWIDRTQDLRRLSQDRRIRRDSQARRVSQPTNLANIME